MSDRIDSASLVPFKSSLPVVQRGLDLVQEWQSSRVRLLIGEARPQASIALRQRFEASSDIDLLAIATTPWAVVDLAQRERPNVILLDFDGMPLEGVAAATVELTELIPSAALIVLEPEDIVGTGHALGATASQIPWAVGLDQWQLVEGDHSFPTDLVFMTSYVRALDVGEPARVLRRIRRAAGLVAMTLDPPAHVLVRPDDLPSGWRLWDEEPAHDWSPSASSRAAACRRMFLCGERPGLEVPVLSVGLNVYSDEQAARDAMVDEQKSTSFEEERDLRPFLSNGLSNREFVAGTFPSGTSRVVRIRAVSGRSTVTMWTRGMGADDLRAVTDVQLERLDHASLDGIPDLDAPVDLMALLEASVERSKKSQERVGGDHTPAASQQGDIVKLWRLCPEHKARLTSMELPPLRGGAWCPEGEHETHPGDFSSGYEYEPGSFVELDDGDLELLGLLNSSAIFEEVDSEGYLVVWASGTHELSESLRRVVDAKLQGSN